MCVVYSMLLYVYRRCELFTMTSPARDNHVAGRSHEGQSTNPWSKLVIAGTVGGACAVLTACFVLCILVCRRWIRDKRAYVTLAYWQHRHNYALCSYYSLSHGE